MRIKKHISIRGFLSASFNESRYEIQGFLHTLFLENEAQTSEKKTKTVYIE